jgi:hypothetical protein
VACGGCKSIGVTTSQPKCRRGEDQADSKTSRNLCFLLQIERSFLIRGHECKCSNKREFSTEKENYKLINTVYMK